MVFFWKRLCAVCARDPPEGEHSNYPDLRSDEALFDIARAFKVPLKRKCPVCSECRDQLIVIEQFSRKCIQSQVFINLCSKRKLFTDDEVVEFRKEYYRTGGKVVKKESKARLPESVKEEPDDESAIHYVETKQEDTSVDTPMDQTEEIEIAEMLSEEDSNGGNDDEVEEKFDPDFKPEVDDDFPIDEDEGTQSRSPSPEEKPKFKRPKNVRLGIPRAAPSSSSRSYKHNLKCRHCDLVLHSKHHHALHEKKHGPQSPVELKHVCEVCGKAYQSKSILRAHSTVHTEDRPFPCDKCSMAFKNPYGLKCHLETHDDNKYICPICGLALGTNHTYHAHLKIHSTDRRYKCPVCPKAFKRHTPLKEHMFGHTDLRPYSCPFCEKTFINGSSCRLHKVRVHPKELAELEASGRNEEVLEKHRNMPSLEELKTIICEKFGVEKPVKESPSK